MSRRRRPTARSLVGVGIGLVLLVAVAWLTAAGPIGRPDADTQVQAEPGDIVALAADCESVADTDENPDCRYVTFVESIQQFWSDEFARRGATYEPAGTTFFSDAVRTACGAASDQVGPFYCPADDGVYLDLDFFDALRTRYGTGPTELTEAYVLAHEYGHHVQKLTGRMWGVRPGSGPASDAIRLELQADCYAGVWAHHATEPSPTGDALLPEFGERDIMAGLTAAETIGDDYIEERFLGTVAPELWAHGSSAQRLRWFDIGFAGGSVDDCDTFSATVL